MIEQTGTYRRIAFGEVFDHAGAVTPRVAALHEAFVAADIQSEPAADGRVPLWEKFTYLAPFAGMTGAARQPVGVIRSEPAARAQLLAAFAEVHALALAEGVPVAADLLDRVLAYVDGVPETMRSSLLIDLSQGKRIEVEALQGAVVRRAALRGVPVPVMTTLYAVLRAASSVTDRQDLYGTGRHRTTTPPRTTLRMRRVARMSASGSPLEQHEVRVLARLYRAGARRRCRAGPPHQRSPTSAPARA